MERASRKMLDACDSCSARACAHGRRLPSAEPPSRRLWWLAAGPYRGNVGRGQAEGGVAGLWGAATTRDSAIGDEDSGAGAMVLASAVTSACCRVSACHRTGHPLPGRTCGPTRAWAAAQQRASPVPPQRSETASKLRHCKLKPLPCQHAQTLFVPWTCELMCV